MQWLSSWADLSWIKGARAHLVWSTRLDCWHARQHRSDQALGLLTTSRERQRVTKAGAGGMMMAVTALV